MKDTTTNSNYYNKTTITTTATKSQIEATVCLSTNNKVSTNARKPLSFHASDFQQKKTPNNENDDDMNPNKNENGTMKQKTIKQNHNLAGGDDDLLNNPMAFWNAWSQQQRHAYDCDNNSGKLKCQCFEGLGSVM